jgi:hypothetical protein
MEKLSGTSVNPRAFMSETQGFLAMRKFILASAILPLFAGIAAAQTPSTPVSPGVIPNQTTPEVIVPPRAVDPGVVVLPKSPAAADPNTIIPGQSGLGLSETEARHVLGEAGYRSIANMTRRPDGGWSATASKNGTSGRVVVDRTGKVSGG